MSKNLLENFECPECRHRGKLEEVMEEVTLVSTITSITEDGDIVYGMQIPSDGSVDFYQCANCGFAIRYKNTARVNECMELARLLQEKTYWTPKILPCFFRSPDDTMLCHRHDERTNRKCPGNCTVRNVEPPRMENNDD